MNTRLHFPPILNTTTKRDNLLKMLYPATMDIVKQTRRYMDLGQIRAQLEIYFEERLEKAKL